MTLPVPEIDDVTLAFPANALDWMPPWEEIPEEFKEGNEWTQIASSWFALGLPETVKFYPHEGVDPEKAFRACRATLGSFQPKHEHKEAAVGYMLSCWFEKVEGWKK
jgi:hypothetical protein